MRGRHFKDSVFEQFARIGQVFAAPKRLEIIDILAQGERDVVSLGREGGMSVANVSRHLQILKSARMVKSRREGVKIFYRLADDDIFDCWRNLQKIAEKRVSEIGEISRMFMQERNSLETISISELWQRIQNSNVVVLDVRPDEEYQQSHIPGSISIPLSQLQERLDELPKDLEVVAYCRGPYCVLSPEAVAMMKKAGIRAIRLNDGLPDWQRAGLPIENAIHNSPL